MRRGTRLRHDRTSRLVDPDAVVTPLSGRTPPAILPAFLGRRIGACGNPTIGRPWALPTGDGSRGGRTLGRSGSTSGLSTRSGARLVHRHLERQQPRGLGSPWLLHAILSVLRNACHENQRIGARRGSARVGEFASAVIGECSVLTSSWRSGMGAVLGVGTE